MQEGGEGWSNERKRCSNARALGGHLTLASAKSVHEQAWTKFIHATAIPNHRQRCRSGRKATRALAQALPTPLF